MDNKQIDLTNIPKRGRIYNWTNSIGCSVKFTYNDTSGSFIILSCKNNVLTIRYLNKEFNINTDNVIKCKLGYIVGKITRDFKIEIGTRFIDKNRDILITDRKLIKDASGRFWKKYKYKCNLCGFDSGEHYKKGKYIKEFWIDEHNILNGVRCSCCSTQSKIVVEGINDIPTTNPWMIKFFQGGYDEAKKYSYGSHEKIYPICPFCGEISNKQTDIHSMCNLKTISCNCGDGKSYNEKFMINLLNQLNAKFATEVRFKWCVFPDYHDKYNSTYGIYDIVIEDKKYIIEMDGGWHRKNNNMSGVTKAEAEYKDVCKDLIAKRNNYKIIRIECDTINNTNNLIDNILKSDLNILYDITNVNWNKCDEFALNNMVKIISFFKNENPNMKPTEIGEVFKLSNTTIRTYLKIGAKHGWCEYNAQKEKSDALSVRNGKPVSIYKNGEYLDSFISCSELSRKSEKLFGIYLSKAMIAGVCTGRYKQHKGFTFKYINEIQSESQQGSLLLCSNE